MFNNKRSESDSNFWISYADLMAGLLFVFILLIGAIVIKSSILKNQLHDKEAIMSKKEKELAQKNLRLQKDALQLSDKEKLLKLKDTEIKKLNALLLKKNTKIDALNHKIVIVQTLLDTKENALRKEKTSLEEYKGKVLVLSNALSDAKDAVKIKDEKLLTLLASIDEKKTKYDSLVKKLQEQKAKIKSLTGIKLQVIAALKEALGSQIDIDKKTGSLKLASNILFDVGSAILRDEAKLQLKKSFEEYIGTLVKNENIRPHLDKIIIEGHTDSDGGYIYNLKLSQNRALAVMQYLLTLDFTKKYNIKPLMVASGRAYLDAIMQEGKENKEASRRIEIKFRLKNEDAMHEIEKVLDAK